MQTNELIIIIQQTKVAPLSILYTLLQQGRVAFVCLVDKYPHWVRVKSTKIHTTFSVICYPIKNDGRKPKTLQTDMGGAFRGPTFTKKPFNPFHV